MIEIIRHSTFALRTINPTYVRCSARKYTTAAVKRHEPLNILFCGADDFSIASLRALQKLREQDESKVASIDVVCRPDKRVGRGLKQIREVPIKKAANELGLPIHQIDTFTNWSPPSPINLVVAVSFGLLVPSRILNAAQYGGLNVHPSLLPDLRGPAPIVRALLKGRSHTGVTLQTMHPTRFDHGAILAQTPAPGISIPAECTTDDLLGLVTPLGAEILSDGIRRGLFVPPVENLREKMQDPAELDHAPKLQPEDRHIDWQQWSVDDIVRYDRVLERLWDEQTYGRCLGDRAKGLAKQVTFHGPWSVVDGVACGIDVSTATAGQPVLVREENSKTTKLGIVTSNGGVIMPTATTIESEPKMRGSNKLIEGLRALG